MVLVDIAKQTATNVCQFAWYSTKQPQTRRPKGTYGSTCILAKQAIGQHRHGPSGQVRIPQSPGNKACELNIALPYYGTFIAMYSPLAQAKFMTEDFILPWHDRNSQLGDYLHIALLTV